MGTPLPDTWECCGCGTTNTADGCFCKSCGLAITDNDIDPRLQALDEVFRKRQAELLRYSEELTDKIEMESRKRIDGMIKTGGIIGMVGVIAGQLSIFVPSVSVNKQIDEAKSKAQKIDDQVEQLDNKVKSTQAKLDDNERVVDEITKIKSNMEAKHAAAEALLRKSETQARDLTKQAMVSLDNARIAENAKYELFIYADNGTAVETNSSDPKVSETVIHAIERLNKAGYRLSSGDVAPVQVDRSEVVYYSELNQRKAQELRLLLEPLYRDIEISYKRNSDNGVRTMLLKLRNQVP